MKNKYTNPLKIGTILASLTLLGLLLFISCTSSRSSNTSSLPSDTALLPTTFYLPDDEGLWTIPDIHLGSLPSGNGTIEIIGIGEFTFDTNQIKTVRPDIFKPGHFSLFDVLVQLDKQSDIDLDYHYDEALDTHVIDTINGESNWWYYAKYAGGWFEKSTYRMDMYPYKNGTEIELDQRNDYFISKLYQSFTEEVTRFKNNGGEVIIPKVTIANQIYTDVKVTPHDIRSDILQPSVITALDVLLSLGEQGEITKLKITWYESIGNWKADPIDNYFVEQIDQGDGIEDQEAYETCGWVYEIGPEYFSGFDGSHIHISQDVRTIVSPEYGLWFWICL